MLTGPQKVSDTLQTGYEIHEWRHPLAILRGDFPNEWQDIDSVLSRFRLSRSSVVKRGGRKSPISEAINGMFSELGWKERKFDVSIQVDGQTHDTPTHNVDYFRNRVAVEMEWNNKDPFFDRDLNNFRLLHQLDVISVGVIITRSDSLHLG